MDYRAVDFIDSETTDCIVVGLFADTPLPDCVASLEQQSPGSLTQLMSTLFTEGQVRWQTMQNTSQLLLIHCGQARDYSATRLSKWLNIVTQQLLQQRVQTATVYLPQLSTHTPDWQLEYILVQLDAACYQLLDFKQDKTLAHRLTSVALCVPGATVASMASAEAIAKGVTFARTLTHLPANVCTPSYLAEQATAMADEYPNLTTIVLQQADLEALKMEAFLAVSKGSHEAPKLIQIHYQGAPHSPPIVLVGKGITFDSGGISLKPANGMQDMKFDMAGAASVLGTIQACAEMRLPINVIGLLACAENMPGGHATRPGDIVTTASGQQVEIVNTDAEGRLVLADTLTFAEQFNPRFVLDMATLTGAIIVALGHVNSGLMTTDDALAELILRVADETQDKVWRMPLDTAYEEALDSPLADCINSPFDRAAGSIIAACFLSRFTKKYPWAHLDIAGSAWMPGKKNQATGRPVRLLIGLLRHVAHSG